MTITRGLNVLFPEYINTYKYIGISNSISVLLTLKEYNHYYGQKQISYTSSDDVQHVFTLCEFQFFKKNNNYIIECPSIFIGSAEMTLVQRVQNKEYSATSFSVKRAVS